MTVNSEPTIDGARDDTTRSSVLAAAGILLSRFAGLAREIALAVYLGNRGVAITAFRAALQIPKLLQNLLGEGALSAAFIPVYSSMLAEGRTKDAGRMAGAVAGLIATVTAALVLIGVLLARPIAALLAPGFSGDVYELTVDLIRIVIPGIGFVVLSAWCLGVLNAHRRFFLSYASPVVWNLAQVAILLATGFANWSVDGIATAAAWGVLIGGVLQFLVQLPFVLRIAPELRFGISTSEPGVNKVLRRFGPAALGRGVVQIGAYLDLVLASFLALGAVGAIALAQMLYVLPISLFAISVAAAELPELSRTTDDSKLVGRLSGGLSRISFFLVFLSLLYIVSGETIVGGLFQHGSRFTADDTMLVWLVLAAYSIGMVSTGSSRLLQNGLFSRGDTAGPAALAGVRVALAASLGLLLMLQLDQFAIIDGGITLVGDLPSWSPLPENIREAEGAPPRLGAVGLAFGSGVAAWIELWLLDRRLRHKTGSSAHPLAAASSLIVPGLVSALVLVAVTVAASSDAVPPMIAALGIILTGGATYVAVARWRGVPEASVSLSGLLSRLRG
jgi:putative peptidoglycan lipid II flippase